MGHTRMTSSEMPLKKMSSAQECLLIKLREEVCAKLYGVKNTPMTNSNGEKHFLKRALRAQKINR